MTMLTPDLLHDYQKRAVNFQCSSPTTMLWLDMGLGKTPITLTSIAHLLACNFLRGVVIVAPIRVIRLVWRQEALKWSHTKHLTFSMLTGTKDQRTRALLRPANIFLVNYENLGWLAEVLQTYFISKNRPLPFDGLVWDEISKCKNSTTERVKATRKILPHFKWLTGLTGTPASNGYKDLHGQYLVVDKGERLGTSKTAFKSRFYRKVGPHKELPYDGAENEIKQLIGDITLEMSAEDYNKLPDLVVNDINIEMPENLRTMYDRMEKEFFILLDSGKEVEMFNQAALTNKCLQFANGAMYPVAGMPLWEPIHDLKLEALEEIIDEAQGQQVLCAYGYRSDAERIMKKFHHLRPINLTECKSEASLVNAMSRWASGDCPLMIGHPACLHPETKVLTEWRGWVRIVDVMTDDKVFDGVEFVEHRGCHYSGYKDVIELFGITMTPDHKLLIHGEWKEARDVQDTGDSRAQALFKREAAPVCESGVSTLWGRAGVDSTKCHQEQSRETPALCNVHQRHIPQDDQHPVMEHLAGYEVESARQSGQELRGSRDHDLSRVGELLGLLQGYVPDISRSSDHRTGGREQTLFEVELSMGDEHGAAEQQKEQPCRGLSGRADALGRTLPSVGVQQDDAGHAAQSGDDCRRSSGELSPVTLWQESATGEHPSQRKAHVYDLVNCGPRHRFVIRNNKGEMFVSHNSMGHGIDGLQKRGHTIVWYGLNWSLDLYDQMNARIRRQGQGAPVICHRILMLDTLDQAQALALTEKASTQAGLRNAVKQYRLTRGI